MGGAATTALAACGWFERPVGTQPVGRHHRRARLRADLGRRWSAALRHLGPDDLDDHGGSTNEKLWRSDARRGAGIIASIAEAVAGRVGRSAGGDRGSGADARAKCGPKVDVVELAVDDCWTRDTGPIFVRHDPGGRSRLPLQRLVAASPAVDQRRRAPPRGLQDLHLPSRRVDLVLEGGSISYDGQGTVLATEQCLLNPGRNPSLSKQQIEDQLLASLGASKAIWLPCRAVDGLDHERARRRRRRVRRSRRGAAPANAHGTPDDEPSRATARFSADDRAQLDLIMIHVGRVHLVRVASAGCATRSYIDPTS